MDESLAVPDLPPEQWDAATAAMMATALRRSGRYRVIERLERRSRYTDGACESPRVGLYLDVETTGLEANEDRIIQLALVPFRFDKDGYVYEVEECVSFLEDPGIPIPEAITRLTGITQEQVAGRSIDDEVVRALAGRSQLVISHNASFDRAFVERRLPVFQEMFWACSMKDIPWESEGFKGRSLEWLAFAHCQMFYDAHRADSDCYMGVHLLATPLPSGGPALAALLRSARTQYVRVWAISAPFEARAALKQRGYGWSPGESGRPKAWYRDVAEDAADAEMVWLGTAVYTNGGAEAVRRDKLDRRLRHSDRVGLPAGSGSGSAS